MRLLKNFIHLIEAVFWSLFYFFPSRGMCVIGVTGTDGKTTTSFLIYQILRSAGRRVSLIATTGAFIGRKKIDTGLHTTSPCPRLLQKLIFKSKLLGAQSLVLEVTSHGLDQNRFWGINFDLAVLTNVTHEHLDYHKTFDRYIFAKSRLFNNAKTGFINKSYSDFADLVKNKNVKLFFYSGDSLSGELKNAVFEKFAQDYNRENATAAVLVCLELGLRQDEIIKGLLKAKMPEGRLDFVENDKGVKVVVDFAHTPNALRKLLEYLNTKKGNGRLIVVFGSAGERDRTKRPLMGKVASGLADFIVLTSEDPRSESVKDINLEIKSGIKRKNVKVVEIENRGKAIYYVLNKLAKEGDVVAICGKGHEKSMAILGKEYSWSDRKAVERALMGKYLDYGEVI